MMKNTQAPRLYADADRRKHSCQMQPDENLLLHHVTGCDSTNGPGRILPLNRSYILIAPDAKLATLKR
jgi:hypothetical protein